MFDHIFRRVKKWEGRLASRMNAVTSSIDDDVFLGKLFLVFVGILYNLFGFFVIRIGGAAFLVALYVLLRFVLPAFYAYSAFIIGVAVMHSVSVFLFNNKGIEEVFVWAFSSPFSAIHFTVLVFILLLFFLLYISFVYVVGEYIIALSKPLRPPKEQGQ